MPVLTINNGSHPARSPWRAVGRMLAALGCLSAWAATGIAQYSPRPKPPAVSETASPDLTGEWRAQLQFTSGAFASIKDLEFMYAFNQGGTMTESSNYDASPPVPPAYGIWRKVGPKDFEAKYEFYVTKPPATFDEIVKGGGWGLGGRGVFVERITLSDDGKSFTSKIKYDQYDTAGKPAEGGGEATGRGVKLTF